jgi:hypothetical protein
MELSNRKILFIQEFLKINSEKAIEKLELVLKQQIENDEDAPLSMFTVEEMENRIKLSERDFLEGKFKTSEDLLKKYE